CQRVRLIREAGHQMVGAQWLQPRILRERGQKQKKRLLKIPAGTGIPAKALGQLDAETEAWTDPRVLGVLVVVEAEASGQIHPPRQVLGGLGVGTGLIGREPAIEGERVDPRL